LAQNRLSVAPVVPGIAVELVTFGLAAVVVFVAAAIVVIFVVAGIVVVDVAETGFELGLGLFHPLVLLAKE